MTNKRDRRTVNPMVAIATVLAVLWTVSSSGGEFAAVDARKASGFVLPGLDGQSHDLADLKGQVVLVNFWASWCTPCLAEMPSVQRLAERMEGKPFAVIAINVGETEGRVRQASNRLKVGFPILLDRDNAVFSRWGVSVLPTTFVLDRQGLVRYVGRGQLDWDDAEMVDVLEQLSTTPPDVPASGSVSLPTTPVPTVQPSPDGA